MPLLFRNRKKLLLPALFLLGRFMLVIATPLQGMRGYGDLVHFFRLAGMGWPFLDYWVEFPPVFPFLSAFLFRMANGQEHVYDYLLILILTLVQAGCLALFLRLNDHIPGNSASDERVWLYFVITLILAYGWWYFDPFAVFAVLLAVLWVVEGKDTRAGLALAFGALVKWFPLLVLAAVWRYHSPQRALKITLTSLGVTGLVWGGLFLASSDYTAASLLSQSSKGSWETVWALMDGNLQTGNFGPEIEHLDPAAAVNSYRNPPVIPSWLALIPFALLGLWLFLRSDVADTRAFIGFTGLTWSLFMLWSPGWSPQWVMYLIPLALLAMPSSQGTLLALVLVLVNLLEWPLLLSRGFFWSLWITVSIRTLLFVFLAFIFSQQLLAVKKRRKAFN